MGSPQEALDGAVDRASEIIWWNRSLTKLNQQEGIDNAESFVGSELIESKGPYVEYVRTPKAHDTTISDFLNSHGYHDLVSEAAVDVLFDGDDSLPLYQHQAETIDAIESDTNDNILAVPTATGKTESFFLPVLNHCLQTDEPGLKSIIIYPMKTLEVDQLNRFIRYLDRINQDLEGEKIKIGIWDGDTEESVGTQNFQIQSGSYIRGLECPRTKGKLRVKSNFNVGTDNHDYPWIRVTRRGIRSGVDILLTNPEALDYIFVNDKSETRGLVGEEPSEHPVEHIVYDEAHVWSGISGASVSLLSRRLKSFYSARDPQITMVSATVDNPAELAASLTGSKESEINEVLFTPEPVPVDGKPDFGRIEPCSLEEIVQVLIHATQGTTATPDLREQYPELANAISTLQDIDVLAGGNKLRVRSSVEQWLLPPIESTIDSLVNTDRYDDPLDIATSEEGVERIVNRVLDSENIGSNWKQFAAENIPEVGALAELFEEGAGSVRFRHYDDLLNAVDAESVDDPEGVLSTVMLLGRLGRILTDKYHTFLKPPSKAYWCSGCAIVSRHNSCRECGTEIPELQFCRRCHHPYVNEDRRGETEFVPLNASETGCCPGCGEKPSLQDINVPTSTLLSFMLTELCRQTPSKKTLVFNDSRSSAETVGGEIIDTEYGLIAESLYIEELLKAGDSKEASEIYFDVSDRLKEEYWKPLKENAIDEEGATYEILEDMRQQIQRKASLQNCRHLTSAALVTSEYLSDFSDPLALAIGHEVFNIFTQNPNVSFQRNRIPIEGLTYDRLRNKVSNGLQFSEEELDQHLPRILARLEEAGFVHQPPWDELTQQVHDSGEPANNTDGTLTYLENERERLVGFADFDQPAESGVFQHDLKEDDSVLRLVERVTYCTNCYAAFPSPEIETLDTCPQCEHDVETYERFNSTNEGYTGTGVANVESDWEWNVDHWGSDIAQPAATDSIETISVGIHKGDVPASLRGAIEEAFRKSNPDINIVSATPTMELGVDIGTLDSVTQVGVPPTLTNYVQRSGRTGRSRGSSSLVSTVIRGEHPVDNHYYANLEAFFSGFEPVRVPEPENYDEVMAGHVFTETLAYLLRNPDPKQVMDQIYSLNESALDLASYQQEVRKRFRILEVFLSEDPQRTNVERHLRNIFGPRGVDIFEMIFFEEGPLNLQQRGKRTFQTLANVDGSVQAVTSLTERYRRLDRWTGLLGYLANYRGFGSQFPIKVSDSGSDDIRFETSGRLFEVFPGPENDSGAVFRLQGTKYIVTDVHGSPDEITKTGICQNEDCKRPFESHDLKYEVCPHCCSPLRKTAIHPIASVTCKKAVGGQRGYSTRPISTVHIDQTETHETDTVDLFGLKCDLSIGDFDVVDFIYAFEQFHSRRSEKKTLQSEAVVDASGDSNVDDPDASLDDLLNEVDGTTYRPVGQQYHTRGLRFQFERSAIRTRFDEYAQNDPNASWPAALVSLEQALEKAIAIIAECDRDDFRVKVTDTEEILEVFMLDSREGGNGVTWQVLEALRKGASLERRVREVAGCETCSRYCDQCLLLARTPAFYLENNLLDKSALQAVIDSDIHIDNTAKIGPTLETDY
ncbi:DEAD/DEAH box helicase [Natronobiforma cellulositropha]|uniref:DEAD/DEAH box helicase n=1 Tax=Natronobiforma cellulositropha TaxID=1679076 RepID=UPI0021D60FF9|nr:DEAD/DEAH box helicase [Natronobiforma cellulositropha]